MSTLHPLLRGSFGYADDLRVRDPEAARIADEALDLALVRAGFPGRIAALGSPGTPRRIVVALTAAKARLPAAKAVGQGLRASRHEVRVIVDARPGRVKFAKINDALRPWTETAEWLLIVDDDVALPEHFLDRFIAVAEAARLTLAQPAHRTHSYASYAVTQRKPRSLVRQTRFVEIGPVTAIHRSLFASLVPFPETRSGWGLDFLWADRARAEGWRLGVVDATPFEHLRPVGSTYAIRAAMAEASAFLERHAPTIDREEMLSGDHVLIGW